LAEKKAAAASKGAARAASPETAAKKVVSKSAAKKASASKPAADKAKQQAKKPATRRDVGVTGEPRIGVFICHCGVNIAGFLDVPDVTEYARTLPSVVYAEHNLYTCAEDGISAIKSAIVEHNLNRVVVASCTPRTHEPLFRAACEEAGLNKYLFEFANIRDQCSWVHMQDWERATDKAKDLVRMSVMRAALLQPLEEISIDIHPASLVIGAGISGMTAAEAIANQGYEVFLVEKENEVGGILRNLHTLSPTGAEPERVIKNYTERIKKNPGIHLYTGAVVKSIDGYFGNFDVTVGTGERDEVFKVGTVIVATGAEEMKPDGLYGYGELENVVTQGQLEIMLNEGRLGEVKDVVMIQCVGSRGQRVSYCNRICCMVAIKNAIALKQRYPDASISVLHNDVEVYGVIQEEWYKRARAMGIRFRKYNPDRRPDVSSEDGCLSVKTYLDLMGREIDIPADIVVLSSPLVQTQGGLDLAKMLRVPVGQDKFFFEAHVKLRPVDFATDGIYVCGTAQGPKDIAECVAQAHAAASHAVNPMGRGTVNAEAITSSVDQQSCIGCGFCAWVCPFGAVAMTVDDAGHWVSSINAALCKGCGACAAGCPTLAITTQHFTGDQTMAQIKAAFPEPSAPGPDFEPQILAFTCNWCSYAGADLAGVSRFQYPPNVRIIRLMCSARIDPLYVLEAFRHNADGVLMSGCHIGDCHYISANLMTEARFNALRPYLAALGVEPERLQLAWISAAEGEKFASVIKEIVETVKKLDPIDRTKLRYREAERQKAEV
jgi:heterodisulfide reductase subunit A